MTASSCPHGLSPSACEICRVLDASPAAPERHVRRPPSPSRGEARKRLSLGTTAVVAVVALVIFSWLAATIWAVVRLLQLLAVAFLAGWVGWRLGVHHGRRDRPK